MKTIIAIAALTLCASAFATQPGQPGTIVGGGSGANNNNTGGVGVGIGVGRANAASTAASTSQAGASAQGGSSSVSGVSGGQVGAGAGAMTISGAGIGNSTTNYQEAAAAAYAPAAHGPVTSCRVFVGIGGASREGSLSGGLPIGNDGFCVAKNALALMDTFPGRFTVQDRLDVVCKLEGMSEASGCAGSKQVYQQRDADKRAGVPGLLP